MIVALLQAQVRVVVVDRADDLIVASAQASHEVYGRPQDVGRAH